MLLAKDARRLAIFAYYDADGIVDDYVVYLLQQMRAQCTAQIVVVNGTLTPESEARVRAHCTQLLFRPNEGFDITGYKEGFLQVSDPAQYDEILFYNQTVFGPVCPLAPMFAAMGRRDVDFWGLTRHKGARKASWDNSVAIAPHLQSFFFAVRRPMFTSDAFVQYWKNLPPIEGYWDAVSKHEVKFTERFASLGFAWDSYLHTDDLEPYNDYPLMGMPTVLLERGCPFVKRKSFLCSRHSYTTVPQGAAPQQLFDYLREKTQYPLSYITQNLLRTADISAVTGALTPVYDVRALEGAAGKTACVLWFARRELAYLLCAAAQGLKRDMTLYYLFADEALRDELLPQLPKNASVLLTKQNGMEYLFGPLWPEVSAHENVLYLNNALPLLLDEFYDATTLESAVQSLARPGCAALLGRFAEIGAVAAPLPMHQECLSLGLNWPGTAPRLTPALERAGIRVPLGAERPGLALRGSAFFARTQAVEPLTHFAFERWMFEGEYPACEFLVPLAAQSRGFLTAFSASPQQAFVCMENRGALLREMTAKWATPRMVRSDQVLFRMQAILDFYYERRYHMTLEQAFAAPLTFKQKLWICLQILLKPETFAKLHKAKEAPPPPKDELE